MSKDNNESNECSSRTLLADSVVVIEIDENTQRQQLIQTQKRQRSIHLNNDDDHDDNDVDASYYYYDDNTSTTTISTHFTTPKTPTDKEANVRTTLAEEDRIHALHAYWKNKECLAREQQQRISNCSNNSIIDGIAHALEYYKQDESNQNNVNNDEDSSLKQEDDTDNKVEAVIGNVTSENVSTQEKEENEEDSQLAAGNESSYDNSSSCSSDEDSEDSSSSSKLPSNINSKKIGIVDQDLIIVDFRQDDAQQQTRDLNSCASTNRSSQNNNIVATKETLLFKRIEALASSTTFSNPRIQRISQRSFSDVCCVDLEIETTASYDTEDNFDDEDQRHLSETTGSLAISATSSKTSRSFYSVSDSSVSISICKPDVNSEYDDEDATTLHRSNITTADRQNKTIPASASSTWSVRDSLLDFLHWIQSKYQHFRLRVKEDDKFRRMLFIWAFSVVIGLIIVMCFLILSLLLNTNEKKNYLTPREILIQNKLSLSLTSPEAALLFQNVSTYQYKAIQWIFHGKHSIPLTYDSPTLIQRYCLAALYFALNGDRWTRCGQQQQQETNETCLDENGNVSQRFLSEQSECSWYGIRCINGNVASITIRENNLVGSLPPELGELKELVYLVLSNNHLNGAVPKQLQQLSKLNTLLLNRNTLTSIHLDSMSHLPNLNIISLGYNSLQGTIPKELFNSNIDCAISMLDLSYNMFSGTISSKLFSCPRLQKINLEGNKLAGTIPSQFSDLHMLQLLMLGNNALSGSMPEAVCALRQSTLQILSSDCSSQASGRPIGVNCTCCTTCS